MRGTSAGAGGTSAGASLPGSPCGPAPTPCTASSPLGAPARPEVPGGGGGRDLLGPARAGGGGAARRGHGPDRPLTGLCFSIRPARGAWDSGEPRGSRGPESQELQSSRVGAGGPGGLGRPQGLGDLRGRGTPGLWGSRGPRAVSGRGVCLRIPEDSGHRGRGPLAWAPQEPTPWFCVFCGLHRLWTCECSEILMNE